MKEVDTFIVGGGISGLSCARRLNQANQDFILMTKDIGGRLMSSKNHGVDYGAAYITCDYKNVMQFVNKREKMSTFDFYFANKFGIEKLFALRNLKYFPKIALFLYHVQRLRRHYLKYRAKAPYATIKECFEKDPALMYYWTTPATEFIKKHNLEDLDDMYGNPVTATTAFIESSKVNTAYYLGMFFCAITPAWIVDFKHTIHNLTKGFSEKVKTGIVHKVTKQKNGKYLVKTSKGNFIAKNVVLAAPQHSLQKVYPVPKPYIQQDAHVFHVVGRRRDIFDGKKAVLFRPHHYDIYMLWKQKNGADLIYSKTAKPDFHEYYEIYHVIKHVHWNPGMIIPDGRLIEQKLDTNLYLASDYNLSLMEDSFLTGLYAANQIITKKSAD